MIYLYYYANRLNRLVCGTSDKSETMMGYFTKWGDAAADILPIGNLYKTQVKELAAYLGVPEEIIAKPPSPRLWKGQLAEDELGIKYELLDLILFGLEHKSPVKEIAGQLSLSQDIIQQVEKQFLMTKHKRRLPAMPEDINSFHQ
jgi:NAD+ synthase